MFHSHWACEGLENYYGDSSLGNVTITGASSPLSVPTIDGDMLVQNYRNLTIDNGGLLIPDKRCRGMLIYCSGLLTVNGTISMTARGAYTPDINTEVEASGLIFTRYVANGLQSGNFSAQLNGCGAAAIASEVNQSLMLESGKMWTIKRISENTVGTGKTITQETYDSGGVGYAAYGTALGSSGCGGGGGSFCYGRATPHGHSIGGYGAKGTCFSGGTGGGGCTKYTNANSDFYAGDGNNYGYYGGTASYEAGTPSNLSANGGVGNIGGNGIDGRAPSGTGGLIIVIARRILIGNTGIIEAKGTNNTLQSSKAGGGSSGGGNILVLSQTLNRTDRFFVTGGISTHNASMYGENGGDGSIQIGTIL